MKARCAHGAPWWREDCPECDAQGWVVQAAEWASAHERHTRYLEEMERFWNGTTPASPSDPSPEALRAAIQGMWERYS